MACYYAAMIKGILIAIGLLLASDFALNQGQVTRAIRSHLGHYAASSSDAVNKSIFRG